MAALDGLKVLEAGLLVQGPQAAATLADWGAEVVKVELPEVGDQARWVVLAPDDLRSAYFAACNRGKRSVTIDLRVPAGRDAFLRLAAGSDVVITNFAPGTLDKWGLSYEEVRARNPRVIYAEGSTFGHTPASANREGADLSAQAAGGLISTTGVDGGDPTPVGVTIADHIASQNLVGGVLAALYARERTGLGQRITASLLGGQIWAQASEYTAQLLLGRPAGPANGGHPLIPGIYGIFPTSDGWIAVVGVVPAAREAFFAMVGHPELTERFPGRFYWAADKRELFPILERAFRTASTAVWCERLARANIRHAPVRSHADVVADPDVWDNGYLARLVGPTGEVEAAVAPVGFSATPADPAAWAPELGQHTEEVLLEAGYSWDDIAQLRDVGAI